MRKASHNIKDKREDLRATLAATSVGATNHKIANPQIRDVKHIMNMSFNYSRIKFKGFITSCFKAKVNQRRCLVKTVELPGLFVWLK